MKSNQSIWAVRVFVLVAFAVTVWLCGPNAAAVLAARFGGEAQPGPTVTLDHVGFMDRPDWLDAEMLVSVAESVSPWLSDEVGLLDEETSRRMREGLLGTSWVRHVRVERVFPDRFRLHLSLRRPLLSVLTADAEPLCLVDEDGTMLPWVDCERLCSVMGGPSIARSLACLFVVRRKCLGRSSNSTKASRNWSPAICASRVVGPTTCSRANLAFRTRMVRGRNCCRPKAASRRPACERVRPTGPPLRVHHAGIHAGRSRRSWCNPAAQRSARRSERSRSTDLHGHPC